MAAGGDNLLTLDRLTEADVARALTASLPPLLDLPEDDSAAVEPRRAAVLLPLVRIDGGWALVFIRRANSERDRHSGQVAFAGGMWEPGDATLQETALREAREEIGVDPADVTVLGQLPIHRSVAGVEITPVVATMPWPYPLRLQAAEVARVFTLPLPWLADAANFEIVELHLADGSARGRSVSYREKAGERLWGATARITLSLIACLRKHCGLPPVLSQR